MARTSTAARISPEALIAGQRLGKALRQARIRRKLTQQQVADRAGVSRVTVINLEHGDLGVASGLLLEVMSVLDGALLQDVVGTLEDDRPGRALESARLAMRVRRSDDF